MKIVPILIKSTTCKEWSTDTLEKYWKPCTLGKLYKNCVIWQFFLVWFVCYECNFFSWAWSR